MEQLTPQEWAREQLKRAPSFAIATAIVALFLLISTVIQYSTATTRIELDPVKTDIAQVKPPEIKKVEEKIEPEKPNLQPIDAPLVEAPETSPVNAPIEDITVDIDVTEDETSDVTQPTDPFPMDRKMAVIGTEAGTGGFRGVLGNRSAGGKRRAARMFEMPKGTDQDILAALRWLARVQESNGSWDCKKWGGGNEDNGVTGLALLAFLGFGCTDKYPTEFAPTVRKAIEYLIAEQEKNKDKEGFFGERMYTQGICTMALCEAFAMTNNRNLREPAQKAIDYICDTKIGVMPGDGSFDYRGGGERRKDNSVACFQYQAIKDAMTAGLNVPTDVKEKAENYFKLSLGKDYSVGYTVPSNNGTPRMTAANLVARLFMGHKPSAPDCVGMAEWANQQNYYDNSNWATPQKTDVYYIYYMSLSMFQMGGQYWDKWNKNFNEPLRAVQEKDGPNKGSWPNRQDVWGGQGGRVYTTAVACLALEVYFRYDRLSR